MGREVYGIEGKLGREVAAGNGGMSRWKCWDIVGKLGSGGMVSLGSGSKKWWKISSRQCWD
jgi:hypothetical protein